MSKHVVVVGGGIIGRCTAYYTAQHGHRVTLIERHAPDHWGCSFGNAGFITPSHFVPLASPGMVALGLKWMMSPESPFYVKPRLSPSLWGWGWRFVQAATNGHVKRSAPLLLELNMASRACFEELSLLTNNAFAFTRRGCLMLCNTAKRFDEERRWASEAAGLGLPAEVLTAEEVEQREPGVHMNIVGAVYFPDDAHVVPDQFMVSIATLLERNGVVCRWGTDVRGWTLKGRTLTSVITSDGEVAGDEFVLCGGSWSGVLARGLGLRLPLQAGKGYSLTLTQPRQRPTIPAIGVEGRIAITPMESSLRFGGTMEIAGMSEEINPARIRGLVKSVLRYYPDFTAADFAGVQPWCGLRPLSPDGLPYVGRTSRYTNLSIGTGHAMLGLSLGPITGKLLAEVVSDEQPSISIEQLSPDRYA